MPAPTPVALTPGSVFRTSALRQWGDNPTRLACRLEREGRLERLGHGFLYAPRLTRFGPARPSDESLLGALLGGTPYLVTGPVRWNALGLGSTALHVNPLVYNTLRTGPFAFGGRTFELRRSAFPREVSAEWFVIDLLRNAPAAGMDPADLVRNLTEALRRGRFNGQRLLDLVAQFGTVAEAKRMRSAVTAAA